MIQATIGTNTSRNKVSVAPGTSLREVLDEQEVNYSVANVHLDGCALKPGDLDKSFADLGITDSCYLIAVIKSDNA